MTSHNPNEQSRLTTGRSASHGPYSSSGIRRASSQFAVSNATLPQQHPVAVDSAYFPPGRPKGAQVNQYPSSSSKQFSASVRRTPLTSHNLEKGLPRVSRGIASSGNEDSLSAFQHVATKSRPQQVDILSNRSRTPAASSVTYESTSAGDIPRNTIRRKAPSIEQHISRQRSKSASRRNDAMTSRNPEHHEDSSQDTVFGILPLEPRKEARQPPTQTQIIVATEYAPVRPKELAGLVAPVITQDLPPPTPNLAPSISPSTRYSESPGFWSSRNTTPTSVSSYSPGIVQSCRAVTPRTKTSSPTVHGPAFSGQQARISNINETKAGTTDSGRPHGPFHRRKSSTEASPGKSPEKLRKPAPTPPPRKSSTNFQSTSNSQRRGSVPEEQKEKAPPRGKLQRNRSSSKSEPAALRQDSKIRPPRPSRNGTSELKVDASPVIQSNLSPSFIPSHRRRESSDSRIDAQTLKIEPSQPQTSMDSLARQPSPHLSSRRPSPSPYGYQSGTSASRIYGTTTNISSNSLSIPDTAPAAAAKSTSRFGIFSKRSKSDNNVEKSARKGPTAGTGHEGYGRYAQRGRRGSLGSNSSSRGRSTSTEAGRHTARNSSSRKNSMNNDAELQEFVRQHSEPIFIRGGMVRTESETSLSRQSDDSALEFQDSQPWTQRKGSNDSTASGISREVYSPDSMVSPRTTVFPTSSRARQGKSRDEGPRNKRALVARDILRESRSPSLGDSSTSQSSLSLAASSSLPEDVWLRGDKMASKSAKKSKSVKWNFFQRSQKTAQDADKPGLPSAFMERDQTTALHALENRHIPHYALQEVDGIDQASFEEIIHQIEDSAPSEEESDAEEGLGIEIKKSHGQSVLLPSPPLILKEFSEEQRRAPSPKVFLRREESKVAPTGPTLEHKPSRLAQVGRIPRVVSTRELRSEPTARSFSRPFRADSLPRPPLQTAQSAVFVPRYPPSNAHSEMHPGQPVFVPDTTVGPQSAVDIIHPIDMLSGDVFLRFPPRKESEVSTSSSEATMTIFKPTSCFPELMEKKSEEDVWVEYDDLIDHVMSPSTPKAKVVAATTLGLERTASASQLLQTKLSQEGLQQSKSEYSRVLVQSPTPVLSPMRSPPVSPTESIRLRRSRIVSALAPSIAPSSVAPSSSMSLGEFVASYGERNKSTVDLDCISIDTGHTSFQSTEGRPPSVANSLGPELALNRNTLLLDIAERDRDGAVAQSNLRFGALMTSRWLSFGRVLFSPAHNLVKNNPQERILVLDGLGNDDWSFYCALTYPTATIYSLSLCAPDGAENDNDGPPNHRTIRHPSTSQPFPFPKGFFAAVVIRFPATSSENSLRMTISECKRVLRPGGYIETSALDLDMVGMGNRTRKAVRKLKMQMSEADPGVCVKSSSDEILKLLGKKGFDNLNRCLVGIPVAGSIEKTGSRDSTSTISSSKRLNRQDSVSRTATSVTATTPDLSASSRRSESTGATSPIEDPNLSLTDLVAAKPSPAADESITKMVAKVGRWWYTRCHEWSVLDDGDLQRSIWADESVLAECRERSTGFRLLIAFAQKPGVGVGRRRTQSV